MTVTVAVTLVAKSGQEDRLEAILRELSAQSETEPGCIHHYVHSLPAARSLLVYERYVDRAAFEAELNSEHFVRLALTDALPLLESSARVDLHPIGPKRAESRSAERDP